MDFKLIRENSRYSGCTSIFKNILYTRILEFKYFLDKNGWTNDYSLKQRVSIINMSIVHSKIHSKWALTSVGSVLFQIKKGSINKDPKLIRVPKISFCFVQIMYYLRFLSDNFVKTWCDFFFNCLERSTSMIEFSCFKIVCFVCVSFPNHCLIPCQSETTHILIQ